MGAGSGCDGETAAQPPVAESQPQPSQPGVGADAVEDGAPAAAGTAAEAAEEGRGGSQQGAQQGHPPGRRRFGVLSSRHLSTQLDMREDSMETLLSYLEVGLG